MINNIICSKCFSKNLYRYSKDKDGFQKYQCKSHGCLHQFTPGKIKKIHSSNYPKCPVCGASTYLHHDYEFYSRFTCNSKKCNHHFSVIKPSVFLKEVAKLPNAINLKRLRTNIIWLLKHSLCILVALVLLDISLNILLILNPLKFHMLLFTNGLKALVLYLKNLLKNIFLKI